MIEFYSLFFIDSRTLCGIILALCFVGTCFELTIDWLESPTSCIKSIGLVAYNSDSYAARVNHGALEEDVNTFASQNSLGSDVKNLAPLEPKKSSAKGNVSSFHILKIFSKGLHVLTVFGTCGSDKRFRAVCDGVFNLISQNV